MLNIPLALFAAIFGVFCFAAIYARNVGPVFGLSYERLANPVFSFGAMLGVLAFANTMAPPALVTIGVVLVIAAFSLAGMVIMLRRNDRKHAKVFELTTNIFLGAGGLMNMANTPVASVPFIIVMSILIASLLAMIALRPVNPVGTAAI